VGAVSGAGVTAEPVSADGDDVGGVVEVGVGWVGAVAVVPLLLPCPLGGALRSRSTARDCSRATAASSPVREV
jgi:hypothetical protein